MYFSAKVHFEIPAYEITIYPFMPALKAFHWENKIIYFVIFLEWSYKPFTLFQRTTVVDILITLSIWADLPWYSKQKQSSAIL